MSQLAERIAQFRKMATDDPENELGHFRLGQLLLEDGQYEEAIRSFRRTLELSPQFSKVFQLLGRCLIQIQKKGEAVEVLRQGIHVADERGDNVPREEMARMLTELVVGSREKAREEAFIGAILKDPKDEAALLAYADWLEEQGDAAATGKAVFLRSAAVRKTPQPAVRGGPEGGFHCVRPGCQAGSYARRLPAPPMNDDLGKRIYDNVCVDCWNFWLRNLSVKVINEMRLDLSTEHGVETYDQIMKETLGLT